MSKKQVYANPKQLQFLNARQKRRSFVGGRGSGKTRTLLMHNYQCMNAMPRGKRFLAALTYDQLLTKTLADAQEVWGACGLKEHVNKENPGHFVIGVRPPAHWPKPYSAPKSYEHVITFINGYTIELLSMEGADKRRGGSYDGGDIDESALLKEEMVTKILLPSIRGNQFRFNTYLKDTLCDFTSAAWLPSGQWIYKTEDLQKQFPEKYFYLESTVYDNVLAYGKERLQDVKRETPPIEWQVEYMNQRMKSLPNGFYPAFSEEKHCVWETFGYDKKHDLVLPHSIDTFLDRNAPLETSWDFNASFTSMIVCQEQGTEFRVGDVLYVEDGEEITQNKIDELTDRFIKAYAGHGHKVMFMYGDRNGNNQLVNSNVTFYQQIQQRLEAAGWEVHKMVEGLDPDHQLKHKYINAILREDNGQLPVIRINQNKCKYLIISIQNSPILPDFKKDKRSERKGDQKLATHLSDNLDNIVFRKYAHLFDIEDVPYQVYFM